MAEIRIYIVCAILFLAKVINCLTVTLCEDSRQGYENVSCPENKTISWKSIIYGESPCQDTSNSNICHSNINTYFNNQCLGQNNCTLPIEILSKNGCQKPPRRLKVEFKCKRNWYAFWLDKYTNPAPTDTCAKTLPKVNCPSNSHIHINYAQSYSEKNDCDSMETGCSIIISKYVKGLCNDKRRCLTGTNKHSCLFRERFASIHYVCTGPTDLPVTDIIPRLSSDYEVETTTIEASNVTSENDKLPVLSLDDDHRVEMYVPSLNRKLYLCSSGWDDFAAGVLCKSFNRTWIGNATSVDTSFDIQIFPYFFHCDGLKPNLFACNFTEDAKDCNTTKVAGAICCQGTGIPGECVTNPSSNKRASEKSGFPTLGVAVGVPVGTICMVCIIVAVVLIRRRCIRESSDKKFSNFMSSTTDDNYLGQQDIALPQYPTNNKVLYSQVPNRNTDTIKNEDGQDYSHQSKDTESPYALSEEGIYDKTNERRHVVNDTDTYSRTVDTVYDSAEQHMKQERKEETYDHVFGQKTEDYYDQTTRT